MLEEDSVIVLRTIKHAESSLVVQCYSSKHGRTAVYAAGMGRRGSRGGLQIFHPLAILNLSLYSKANGTMASIKEVSPAFDLSPLRNNMLKGCMAMFMSELFLKTVVEEEPNQLLYTFLQTTTQMLAAKEGSLANFPLMFLLHLSSIIGFKPQSNYSHNQADVFALNTGSFENPEQRTIGISYLSPVETDLLKKLLNTDFQRMDEVKSNGATRNSLIQGMLSYLSIHLGHDIELKSLQVLHEIFA